MLEMTLPPKSKKIGIEADIENLELRLKIQKEWVSRTERDLEKMKRKLKKEKGE